MSDIKHIFNNATIDTDLVSKLVDSFSAVCDVLRPHCGPYALNAIIAPRGRIVVETDVVTKDGISIVSALLSDKSPEARFAGRITRFLGSITDKKSHDGTTTAMLLFASLCKNYFSALKDKSVDRVKRFQNVRDLTTVSEKIVSTVNESRLTVDDFFGWARTINPDITRDEVVRAIAYQVALIASKGDTELSTVVADVVMANPIDLHGLFIKTLAADENAARISVVKRDYQFDIPCAVGASVFNTDMNQKLSAPNSVVYATHTKLLNDTAEEEILVKFLSNDARSMRDLANMGLDPWEECHNGRHLIIISPQVNSYRLQNLIDTFNGNHPKNPIVVATSHVAPTAQVWMGNCLYALRGVRAPADLETPEFHKAFLENVDATYAGNRLRLNNLFERTEGALNPKFVNPEIDPIYTSVRKECEKLLIEHSEDPSSSGMTETSVNQCIYYYRFLCCQQIVEAEIGGLVHENKTLQTVYCDTMGSALSAITKGVVSDVFVRAFNALNNSRAEDLPSNTVTALHVWAQALRDILSTVHEADFLTFYNQNKDMLQDKVTSVITDPDTHTMSIRRLTDHDVLKQFFDPAAKKPVALIQPYVGAREQVVRVCDLLPKIAGSNLLIDTGHIDHVEHVNTGS